MQARQPDQDGTGRDRRRGRSLVPAEPVRVGLGEELLDLGPGGAFATGGGQANDAGEEVQSVAAAGGQSAPSNRRHRQQRVSGRTVALGL